MPVLYRESAVPKGQRQSESPLAAYIKRWYSFISLNYHDTYTHISDYELLACDILSSCRQLPIFQCRLLPPSTYTSSEVFISAMFTGQKLCAHLYPEDGSRFLSETLVATYMTTWFH